MSFGHLQADALAAIARGPEDQLGRDDPVREDQPVVVDVVDEQVQGPDPLLQPALDPVPLVGGDQPGDRVERDDPLDPLVAAVDGEGDPLMPHHQVGRPVAALQLVGPELAEPVVQRRVVRARPAPGAANISSYPARRYRLKSSELMPVMAMFPAAGTPFGPAPRAAAGAISLGIA